MAQRPAVAHQAGGHRSRRWLDPGRGIAAGVVHRPRRDGGHGVTGGVDEHDRAVLVGTGRDPGHGEGEAERGRRARGQGAVEDHHFLEHVDAHLVLQVDAVAHALVADGRTLDHGSSAGPGTLEAECDRPVGRRGSNQPGGIGPLGEGEGDLAGAVLEPPLAVGHHGGVDGMPPPGIVTPVGGPGVGTQGAGAVGVLVDVAGADALDELGPGRVEGRHGLGRRWNRRGVATSRWGGRRRRRRRLGGDGRGGQGGGRAGVGGRDRLGRRRWRRDRQQRGGQGHNQRSAERAPSPVVHRAFRPSRCRGDTPGVLLKSSLRPRG